MILSFKKEELLSKLSSMNFKNDGDNIEKNLGCQIIQYFANTEKFWKFFIVPITKRIDNQTEGVDKIRKRDNVSDDIFELSLSHYTSYVKIYFANEHIISDRNAAIDEFYTHLVSACDLAEDFFQKFYFVKLEVTNERSELIKYLSKTKFLKLAGSWYDDNYSKIYDNYLKKGKSIPINLPNRKYILDEYFNDNKKWKNYISFSKQLREYRNIMVHGSIIGKLVTTKGVLIPKKEKIQKYKKLGSVLSAANDFKKLQHDFIDLKTQTNNDWIQIQIILNDLWQIIIDDYYNLLYNQQNEKLLKKFDIVFE